MAFTEFYCRSGGSNLNGGGLATGAEPPTAAAYTCTNSNWDGTSIFTPTDGSTPANTVNVGDFASVFLDAASVAVYIARVTNVAAGVNGAITLSTTAKSGTAPTGAANGRTIKVGGAWKGPNAAENFPYGFITSAATDSGADTPRVNLKGGSNFAVTSGITHSNGGVRYEGYTATAGDGGRAIIDGTVGGASYTILTITAADTELVGLIFQNNGTSGGATGVLISQVRVVMRGCVFNNLRGHGLNANSASNTMIECEAYACNQSNGSGNAGFSGSNGATFKRCISHDNAGSNSIGFNSSFNSYIVLEGCIADTNGAQGYYFSGVGAQMFDCDAYNNSSDGVRLDNSGTSVFYIENCNFVKNGGYGVNGSGTGTRMGAVNSCGFGTGTQANTSGTTTGLKGVIESGSVSYASGVTPWVDPANGDFRINLLAAKGAGRGVFTQTQGGYSGAVGFPDIGSNQHLDAGGLTARGRMGGDMNIAIGATSQSIDVLMLDDSGKPVTGLLVATFPTVRFHKAGSNVSLVLSLVDAAVTDPWQGGTLGAVDPPFSRLAEKADGIYRLDLPNGISAAASIWTITGEATGKHLIAQLIQVGNIPGDVRAVNAVNVGGAGTVTSPWGPA